MADVFHRLDVSAAFATRVVGDVALQPRGGRASGPRRRRILELVKIRASQINGCAFCIDMHTKDARAMGESERAYLALDAWRESPLFSSRERAALALTEAVTLITKGHVSDAVYAEAASRVRSARALGAHHGDRRDQRVEPHRDHHADGARPLPARLYRRGLDALRRRRDALCRLIAFAGAMQRGVGREALGDAHDLAAERLELQLDRRGRTRPSSSKTLAAVGMGTTYGTAHPRSARVANSIVLMACRPCVPPAALISPITSSCRNAGSRLPSTCSQSSAFLKAPRSSPDTSGCSRASRRRRNRPRSAARPRPSSARCPGRTSADRARAGRGVSSPRRRWPPLPARLAEPTGSSRPSPASLRVRRSSAASPSVFPCYFQDSHTTSRCGLDSRATTLRVRRANR